MRKQQYRIGQGMDVHAFCEGRPLILGGVHIAHPRGLAGHSDADVLMHAITDALLGAAAKGDIGKLYPDTDAKWKNANSAIFLKGALELIKQDGWYVLNLDCTLLAQEPKIAPYSAQIIANLAGIMELDADCISLKASTSERLGFVGRAEGILASAVVMLERES